MQPTIGTIATNTPTTPYSILEKKINQFLDYAHTHPDAAIQYTASEMHLWVHTDASYLSESKARSWAGGYFFLSDWPKYPVTASQPDPPHNGSVHILCKIIDAVMSSAQEASGPFIIKLTGPLLQIVGDCNPSSVKIAIIKTLGLILTKGGASLCAFVPQFQTTFSKALTDPSRQVHIEAIKALGLLMPLSTRVDPLLKELVSNSLGNGAVSTLESAGLVAVQTATLEALANVLKKGGKKAKLPDSIPSALKAGRTCLFHEDEGVRIGAAKVIASSCKLSSKGASEIVTELLQNKTNSIKVKHGLISLYRYILSSDVGPILQTEVIEEIKELVVKLIQDDSVLVKEMAVTAGAIILGVDSDLDACMEFLEGPLLKCMSPKETMEVLKGIAKGLCIAVQLKPGMFTTKIGRSFLEAALENAMSGNQRVQLAYNDFLWLALRVQEGEEGLLQYTEAAMFDKAKKMKSLYLKVLIRIKGVEIED